MLQKPINLPELNTLIAHECDYREGQFALSGYADNYTESDTSDWNNILRVSIEDNHILGYFSAIVNRKDSRISNISLMSFSKESKYTRRFIKDGYQFLHLLLSQFRKIEFTCYGSNKRVLAVWKYIVKKYNGRYIGCSKRSCLINGVYEDSHHFEIFAPKKTKKSKGTSE